MRVRRWLLLAVPALALGALGWRTLRPREVRSAPVQRGTSVSAVYASGAVEPVDRVDVASRVSGPLVELPFRPGDVVKKGDLLARIDAPTLGFDVSRARADENAASARLSGAPSLEAVRAQRAAIAAQLAQARSELARVESLHKSGSTSIAEVDRIRAQVEALAAQVAASEAQERDVKIVLQADAARQRAVLDNARSRLTDTEIRSPLVGTILQKRVEVGQVVAVNQVLVRVGDLSRLQLEVDVDEADVARVRVGQPSAIRLYALPSRAISGRVSKIHPEADRDRKAFRVEISLDEKVEGLYPGMTAEVNIVLARHDNVLLVPLEAVHGDRVWVVEAGQTRSRPITIKQKDLVYAEVEGLPEGAEVVVGDDTGLKDGSRVRTTPAKLPAPESGSSGALSSRP
jgi:multidrug efflux pump subunit AcrA (membrane-fusion protein)